MISQSFTKADASLLLGSQMRAFHEARLAGTTDRAWQALERAHIISQPFLLMHLSSHWHMLRFAIVVGDGREAVGQVFRLALVPLGSMTGRIPVGNNGRARVSAFAPMAIPDDLKLAMQDSNGEQV